MTRRRNEAVREGALRNLSPVGTARLISERLRPAIIQGRSLSMVAAESRIRAEIAALGLDVRRVSRATRDAFYEFYHANRLADSYAKQWLRKAASSDAKTARDISIAASAGTNHALQRTAITESSIAYGTARLQEARRLADSNLVQRVWDAQLDKRACPRCFRADGTIVGLRESFPEGEPGSIHARCRCTWSLVTIFSENKKAA